VARAVTQVHAKHLVLLCRTLRLRTRFILQVYCYLRNLKAASYWSPKVQGAMNDAAPVARPLPPADPAACSHCGSEEHGRTKIRLEGDGHGTGCPRRGHGSSLRGGGQAGD
jgi:hypothetical protein